MTGPPIGWLGLFHIVLFGVTLPVAGVIAARRFHRMPLPPRRDYFISAIVQQAVFGAITLGIAWQLAIPLFPPRLPGLGHLAVGAATLLIVVAILRPLWLKGIRERQRTMHLTTPRDWAERLLWVAISIGAGVFEEATYRGVLFVLVGKLTGSLAMSAALCSVAFAAAHLIQGVRAAAVIALFAVGFHLMVATTGSLYLAILWHIGYDLIAGLTAGRLAERYHFPNTPNDWLAQTPS